jgi:hypothetical protein
MRLSRANSDGLFTSFLCCPPAANNSTFQEKTMKKLQQLCMAGVFTLVLTMTAFAGHIQTPGVMQPPPDESSPTTLGDTETGPGVQNPEAISDSVTDIALDLLQTMLSVF